MKFSIKDFFNKCDQIRRKLRIWSHLLKKSLIENFIFLVVHVHYVYECLRVFASYLPSIFYVDYMPLVFNAPYVHSLF